MPDPDEEIQPEIHKGIPLRVGACRCVLGTLRNDPEVVEATEDLNNHDNVTGCSERDPKHIVKYTTVKYKNDDNEYPYFTAMSPWSKYPRTIGTGTLANEDTHLVIKARGELKKGGDGVWLFPKVKLTIRPVSSKLEYKWISDAVANQNVDATTEFGGGYEETVNGESIGMDFDYLHAYQAPTIPKDADGFADSEAEENAKSEMKNQWVERGLPIELEGEFYYKNSDMPDGLHQQYAPPLQPWEIDLNLYPHAVGEANYDLKMNESWDLRYRFPLWYPTYGGVPNWTTATGYTYGKWIWTPATDVFPSTNPFLKKANAPVGTDRYYNGIPNHLVPVEKYLRIQAGSLARFPIIISNSANQSACVPAMWLLHKDKHMQIVTKVRKRYPFSFQTMGTSASPNEFDVLDQNPANVFQGISNPYEYEYGGEDPIYYAYTLSVKVPFRGTDQNYYPDVLQGQEKYKCQSWWRMEIEAEACEWNYNEKLGKGWTIKGKIYFAKKILATFSTAGGGLATARGSPILDSGFWYLGVSPTSGVYAPASFGFLRPEDTKYDDDAGDADFSVTISPANATGGTVKVFDFPIGGIHYMPNEDGGLSAVVFGDPAENSINFIRDFVITEIIPPTQG